MAAMRSSCVNHPSIESVNRCKQCGKPFCGACEVIGPTGRFCSDGCKQSHEAYVQRAQQLDVAGGGFLSRIGRRVKKVLVFAAFFLVICLILIFFFNINVPIIGPFVNQFR